MRRVLTVLALALAMAGLSAPAYAAPPTHAAGPAWQHRAPTTPRLVIERLASPVHLVAPGVDPEPSFPAVTVHARVTGCVPGALYVAHARFFQHRREITAVDGGLGADEFICGADGTGLIHQSRYDPMSRLHAGCLYVTFEVLPFDQTVVLASGSARVRIPRG